MAGLSVSRKVRRQILDGLQTGRINWPGALDEVRFFERIWDLDEMPSTDRRFTDMRRDIRQHRMNNNDWDDDWIYSDLRLDLLGCSDETFLQFLSALVHPVVRKDPDEAETLVRFLNDCLRPEGVVLTTAAMQPALGRPARRIYAPAPLHSRTTPVPIEKFESLLDGSVMEEHLCRIDGNIDTDPALSIGSSKELLESLFKQIIGGCGESYETGADLNDLYKLVSHALQLDAESVPNDKRGSEAAQRVLRSTVSTVNNLAELRNQIGLGHGRPVKSTALARHARLAATSSRAIAEFLLETWLVREARSSVDQGT